MFCNHRMCIFQRMSCYYVAKLFEMKNDFFSRIQTNDVVAMAAIVPVGMDF